MRPLAASATTSPRPILVVEPPTYNRILGGPSLPPAHGLSPIGASVFAIENPPMNYFFGGTRFAGSVRKAGYAGIGIPETALSSHLFRYCVKQRLYFHGLREFFVSPHLMVQAALTHLRIQFLRF